MANRLFPQDFTRHIAPINEDKLMIYDSVGNTDKSSYLTDLISAQANQIIQLSNQNTKTGLLPIMIRNVERMNHPWPAGETRWTITSHDTTNKIITLNRALPFEIADFSIDPGKRWQMQGATAGDNIQITAIDWIGHTVSYSTLRGTLAVGQNVTWWNPFRNFVMNPFSYLIKTNAWATVYTSPGGIWLHSDGWYRMIVNGKGAIAGMTGLYKSSDLLTWTDVTGAYYYKAGTAPFNQAWCVGTGGHYMIGSPVKVPGTANYAISTAGVDAGGVVRTGIIIINEDYGIVSVPATGLSIPGYTADVTHLVLPGGMIYIGSQLYIAVQYRSTASSGYKILWMKLDSPTTYVCSDVEVVAVNKANTYGELTLENYAPYLINGELFIFSSGENSTCDGPLGPTNEVYGVFHKRNGGVWQPHVQNPVVANPMYGENVYSGCTWAIDHMGASPCFIQRGNYLYLFISMCNGTDSYGVAKMDMQLTI
jgi:hypothetical protein